MKASELASVLCRASLVCGYVVLVSRQFHVEPSSVVFINQCHRHILRVHDREYATTHCHLI